MLQLRSCTFDSEIAGLIPRPWFLARDVMYTSRWFSHLCYNVGVRLYVCLSVHLSVMEVHWRIIANSGFKLRSQVTARALRSRCMRARGKGSLPGRVEGSSRTMLATARPSCPLSLPSTLSTGPTQHRGCSS